MKKQIRKIVKLSKNEMKTIKGGTPISTILKVKHDVVMGTIRNML